MPRAPKEPPRIPGYDILEPIGSGGQGSVWRARQVSLDRVVAIKVLWAEDASDPVLARRFIDEARIASKLNHPNIIQVIDVGETDGTYWYAMEYVAGVTALDLFRERGPLPEGEVLEVAWQVAQALQHGADRGLVHGDLKPENILITPEGVAKVVDFGLARLSRKRGWHASREEEPVQGTEGFVAPEVLENKSMGDARSDLFALGVTLYELFTTTLPPAPKKGSKLGPDVRERRPNATRRTAELIMRLLSPDPARRPESAASVLEELGRRSMITLPATVSPVAPVKPPQSARLHRAERRARGPPARDRGHRRHRGDRRRDVPAQVDAREVVEARDASHARSPGEAPARVRKPPPSVPPPTPATSKPDPVPAPVAPVETRPARGERISPPVAPVPEPDRLPWNRARRRRPSRSASRRSRRRARRRRNPPPSRGPRRAAARRRSPNALAGAVAEQRRSGERTRRRAGRGHEHRGGDPRLSARRRRAERGVDGDRPGRRAVRSPGSDAARLRIQGHGRRGRERRKGEGPHGQERGNPPRRRVPRRPGRALGAAGLHRSSSAAEARPGASGSGSRWCGRPSSRSARRPRSRKRSTGSSVTRPRTARSPRARFPRGARATGRATGRARTPAPAA